MLFIANKCNNMKNYMEKFEDLKRRFSLPNVTESQKQELIQLMQQNLKIRNGQNSATIKCLDGKEHCITSDNVEDLYAISATLDYNENKQKTANIDSNAREKALGQNKYSPDNPYPTNLDI